MAVAFVGAVAPSKNKVLTLVPVFACRAPTQNSSTRTSSFAAVTNEPDKECTVPASPLAVVGHSAPRCPSLS